MDGLNIRLKALNKALNGLKTMLNKYNSAKSAPVVKDIDDIMAYRDSSIKRFELCFDLFWKSAKDYLSNQYKIEMASPKKVFQECFKQSLINEGEAKMLLNMTDDRNTTTHLYDEITSQEMIPRIEEYYTIMVHVAKKL